MSDAFEGLNRFGPRSVLSFNMITLFHVIEWTAHFLVCLILCYRVWARARKAIEKIEFGSGWETWAGVNWAGFI